MKAKVGILGATGYTGIVLTKLLLKHPEVKITYLSSEQYAERELHEVYPTYFGTSSLKLKSVNLKDIAKSCDIVFCATPNGFAKEFLPKLLNENNDIKAIDLSADFRLEEGLALKKKKIAKITYGLCELNRKVIKDSQVIANPGCYPTSIILALAPAIKNKIINLNSIIADSKSGVSGAGRQLKSNLQFCEVNESFAPYNLAGKHRHISEIENELNLLASQKEKFNIVFSPHLIPVNRGIISTIYADLNNSKLGQKDISKLYSNFYSKEYFVKVLNEDSYANTRNVKYTNFCHITPLIDKRANKLIIVSAIDNMMKGASGQAIQNMNIILDLKENTGLEGVGEIP